MSFQITKSYPDPKNHCVVVLEITSPQRLPEGFFSDLGKLVHSHMKKDLQMTVERLASFNKFWSQYGRKDKKNPAREAWLKLSDDEIKKIFATLPKFLDRNRDKNFRPMPLTYLNQRRWEDEEETVTETPAHSWAQKATFKTA